MYNSYCSIFSEKRLSTYLNLAGGDQSKAIELYRLNMLLSHSLYPLVCIIEITLRNKISNLLKKQEYFGDSWFNGHNGKWFDDNDLIFEDMIVKHGKKGKFTFSQQQLKLVSSDPDKVKSYNEVSSINEAKRKILSQLIYKKPVLPSMSPKKINSLIDSLINSGINSDNLTANLNFGFWTGIMKGEYKNGIWDKKTYNNSLQKKGTVTFIEEVFSDCPKNHNFSRDRENFETISKSIYSIKRLRDRIAHHEPLFGTTSQKLEDLIRDYYDGKRYLSWLSKKAPPILDFQDTFITIIKSFISETQLREIKSRKKVYRDNYLLGRYNEENLIKKVGIAHPTVKILLPNLTT